MMGHEVNVELSIIQVYKRLITRRQLGSLIGLKSEWTGFMANELHCSV